MMSAIRQFPHCDARILHAPGECDFCDTHQEWQELREAWDIAFTGHPATVDGLPCPADHQRPPGSPGDHRLWGGNKPTSARDNPEDWPEETLASQMFYGGYEGPGDSEAVFSPSPPRNWLRKKLDGLVNEIRFFWAFYGR